MRFMNEVLDEVMLHVGLGARHLLANAIPERADDVERLGEIFRSHYAEHMLETVEPYPGVRRTLEELRDRGWLLGVNTAKPRFATVAILEHFGLMRYFGTAIVAGGDCAEMKPSALPLSRCSAMVDSTVGVQPWFILQSTLSVLQRPYLPRAPAPIAYKGQSSWKGLWLSCCCGRLHRSTGRAGSCRCRPRWKELA